MALHGGQVVCRGEGKGQSQDEGNDAQGLSSDYKKGKQTGRTVEIVTRGKDPSVAVAKGDGHHWVSRKAIETGRLSTVS